MLTCEVRVAMGNQPKALLLFYAAVLEHRCCIQSVGYLTIIGAKSSPCISITPSERSTRPGSIERTPSATVNIFNLAKASTKRESSSWRARQRSISLANAGLSLTMSGRSSMTVFRLL